MTCSSVCVPISAVDGNDTTFQISTDRNTADLARSISAVGLLVPPTLMRTEDRLVIVNGFRRIAACRSLNQTTVSAGILPATATPRDCAEMAVAENALQRPLNLIERSRALSLLSVYYEDTADLAAASAKCGIPESPPMIRKLRGLCRLSPGIQAGIIDGTLSLAMASELQRFDEAEREVLAKLLLTFRMSLGKQREILTMIEEISRREGLSIPELLRTPTITSLLADDDTEPNVKVGRLRELLKRRRYPAIQKSEEQATAFIRALGLKNPMKLVLPPNLEGETFSLTLRFRNIAELRHLHHTLGKIIDRPELDRLLSKDF